MSKYKDLQKYISEYFSNKTKKELENELFYENPELFNEIAKYRQYGIPKRYKDAVKKYNVDPHMFFFESNLARQYTGNPRYIYERMVELYPIIHLFGLMKEQERFLEIPLLLQEDQMNTMNI